MSEYDASGDVYFTDDGTTVTDPYQDALGQVYEDGQSYIDGTDPYEITGYSGDTALADPVS